MRCALFFLAMVLASAPLSTLPARAQSMLDRLSQDELGSIEPGTYLAGDSLTFTLDQEDKHLLLRFAGVPEVFVLYSDPGDMGGRILKYDSGETALRVTGYGGITIYTDAAPDGLPAARTGDSLPPALPQISLTDMQNAAQDETEHLAYVRGLQLFFNADWAALANDANERALAFDTMENAARGIERFTAQAPQRQQFAHDADAVLIATAAKPTLALKGKTLLVTFNPGEGYVGRASSRAIARALSKVLPRK